MVNLIGQKFNRLTVIAKTKKRGYDGSIVWLCECECGGIAEATGPVLKHNKVRSCGCLMAEVKTIHGESKTRLYCIWSHMKRRCLNPKASRYHKYGGRGIKICSEWIKDFPAFRDWAVANGYNDDLTIDRIDNDGNYQPDNCQWLTRSENSSKRGIDNKKAA